MSDLILRDEEAGVTDYARRLLVGDARLQTERTFVMKGDKESQVKGTILHVWRDYESDPSKHSLHVIEPDGTHLIHRKPSPRFGFTSFAKEELLYEGGHVRDTKNRVYVMGGKDPDGKRIRREMKVTILVAWLDYAAHTEYKQLWVKWKDGTRRLVHRKGL